MKSLVIVESPNKVKTISKYLGQDFIVMASYGHVRGIPRKKDMVNVNTLDITYDLTDGSKKHVQSIVNTAKGNEVKDIYLCTDPDREGEAISWHIKELLVKAKVKKPIKRAVFHEITARAVTEAISNPRDIDDTLVKAQMVRQAMDYCIGFMVSPFLHKNLPYGYHTSAGRVQSPALQFIYERDKKINEFTPTVYWDIDIFATHMGIPFKSSFFTTDNLTDKYIISSKEDCNRILADMKGKSLEVIDVKIKNLKIKPKAPFTTSTFQQEVVKRYKWSSKRAMDAAQTLFTDGQITYIRTDSSFLSEHGVSMVKEYLNQYSHDSNYHYTEHQYGKKVANAQEAHECIRPSDISVESIVNEDLSKIYRLIWERTVASRMPSAVVEETTVTFKLGESVLICKGRRYVSLGFMVLYKDHSEENISTLPLFKVGDIIAVDDIVDEEKKTKPPSHYNEATLIAQMEKTGVGRPSTYSTVIGSLRDRGYVEDGKDLVITDKGRNVITYLTNSFPRWVDCKFTSEMEESLDRISRGELGRDAVLRMFCDQLNHDLDIEKAKPKTAVRHIEDTDEICPQCGKGHLVMVAGRYSNYYRCSKYLDDGLCDYKRSNSASQKEQEPVGRCCPSCNKPLIYKHSRKGTKFIGCSGYPDCKHVEWLDQKEPVDTGRECPQCARQHLFIVKGRYGDYIRCGGNKGKKSKDTTCSYTEKIPKS